jgi:hypothetical protein
MSQLSKAPSSREQAAALIIVLAFVVLLTGLSLAYLSRTTSDRQVAHSSFHQSKVDELAASAMDLIIGDLQTEIANGSSPTPTPFVPASIPTPTPFVYPLTSPANIVPMQWPSPTPGTTPAIPNLLRRSLRYDERPGPNAIPSPSPGVASHASAVSSTEASANGRYVAVPRWNKHYLIPRLAGAAPTDPTPDPAVGFVAPDWVIVTRNGPTAFSAWGPNLKDPTQSNNFYCVGRYAYAIYDQGGLLDVNVAGYPTNSTASQYGPKGVSAFADLSVLGLSASGNPNDINAMVGWRNYVSARQSGNFPSFNLNAVNFLTWVLSNTDGFMSVSIPNPIPNNMTNTDQQFTTRQSLIQLLVNSGLSATAPNALQYLGTFSRELNAPCWTPTLNASDMGGNNAGGLYAYATNANSSTTINPNFLNVRVCSQPGCGFTRADGTSTVIRNPCDSFHQALNDCGEPLINRRFPLTRLTAITSTGPNTTTNSTIIRGMFQPATTTSDNRYPELPPGGTIQRDFGLQWDDTNKRWNYVGGSGSTIQTAIERLDQVAPENREPNFFELLKAAILSGSVGIGSGTGTARTFVAAETKYYDTTNNLSSDYQIMQIGANIISQWDSDPRNIPTFIAFGLDTSTTPQPYELAGIKNLPYLNKFVFKPYWNRGPGSTWTFEAWVLPSSWNPHQNAPPATQNIRLTFTSGTMSANTTSPNTTSSLSSPEFMTFDAHDFATTSPSAPANVVSGQTSTNVTRTPDSPRYWGFHFPQSATTAPTGSTTTYPDFGSGCDFEMQVRVSTSPEVWKTYQRWKGCRQPATQLRCQSPPDWTASLQDPEFVTLDPRTLRFGVWGNAGVQSGVSADYADGTQGTLDWPGPPPSAIRFEHITALPPQGSMFASSSSPDLYLYAKNEDTTVHYTDLDDVQRLGDFLTSGARSPLLPSNSADRPLILAGAFQNGVFQSVAELGHVFRDQPWKTLTFTTASPNSTSRSADAGLLDVFTLHESAVEAGKTSLNTKQPLVLKAILSGAIKRLAGSSSDLVSADQVDDGNGHGIVPALLNLTATQPMVNKPELVTRLAASSYVTGLGNKEARECVLRAFSDACQTRTWNLMIDVIAQSGRYPSNANSLAGFVVEGEQHYWVHVAIDRFTGQVLDRQIEVVTE